MSRQKREGWREQGREEKEEEEGTVSTEGKNQTRQAQTAGVKEERGCGNGEQEGKEEQVRSTDKYQGKKKRKTREKTEVLQTQRPDPVGNSVWRFLFFPTADGDEFLGKLSRTCRSKQGDR